MQQIPVMPHEQYQRLQLRRNSPCAELWDLLDEVKDPEIPVLSLWDLGVLRDVRREDDTVQVTITPTYSGCPAMDVMREDIEILLRQNGIKKFTVKTVLAPAWTTDWMTEKGRAQLRDYGIAAPNDVQCQSGKETPEANVRCPHCGSSHTDRVSEFASTACKALFQCRDCSEPFDYFKNI
ncbi:phenylacetate-CoA oxygenase subunit PaaJ [Dasania sp. GY-MA-18]|uniref:Phenylacetate-CoA oxygenase subunit PaaJ n=1 Tax=Dasania phycosphaerae TaxID=2950436 RepID=A0A9J6RSH1_9GAMM|nr:MULTISPECIES: 1,2-phenylacetyl-CoA epoxidase subunit PaaD [Dasania]MCR8924445.1 phenylacetate-CoA oxygenase subunit PaaJ [Dasania sp. GY-MA-18]MCZ0867120.1 phenylacetate-CoA oxygenase subunit PaaJ [Dasania phycosphaerae]MCZ0870572.1 phenylacetate-CoA oxygenase subunit PaaJ [Dasania phycosphaerae]